MKATDHTPTTRTSVTAPLSLQQGGAEAAVHPEHRRARQGALFVVAAGRCPCPLTPAAYQQPASGAVQRLNTASVLRPFIFIFLHLQQPAATPPTSFNRLAAARAAVHLNAM